MLAVHCIHSFDYGIVCLTGGVVELQGMSSTIHWLHTLIRVLLAAQSVFNVETRLLMQLHFCFSSNLLSPVSHVVPTGSSVSHLAPLSPVSKRTSCRPNADSSLVSKQTCDYNYSICIHLYSRIVQNKLKIIKLFSQNIQVSNKTSALSPLQLINLGF